MTRLAANPTDSGPWEEVWLPQGRFIGFGPGHPPKGHGVRMNSDGVVVRFTPAKGQTPKSALSGRLYLPAVLNTYHVDESALHTEYDTISDGQFSTAAMGDSSKRQLRALTLDSLTVALDTSWLTVAGQVAEDVLTTLREILRTRKPVYMLVVFNPTLRGKQVMSALVTFRSFSEEIRAGETEARYFTIAIKEWRDPSNSVRVSSSGSSGGKSLPTTATLAASDTLESLSYEWYGRYDAWRSIRDANGIPANWGQSTPLVQLPGRWQAGLKIKIPVAPKASS